MFPVPVDKILDCRSAVGIHRHGSGYLTAFDDGSVEKEIGPGFSILVDIVDCQRKQFGDPAASVYTKHEESTVSVFINAIKAGENEPDFGIIEGACAITRWEVESALSRRYVSTQPSCFEDSVILW